MALFSMELVSIEAQCSIIMALFSTELVEIRFFKRATFDVGKLWNLKSYDKQRADLNRVLIRVMDRELGAIPNPRTSGQLFAHVEIKMNGLRLKQSVRLRMSEKRKCKQFYRCRKAFLPKLWVLFIRK